MAESTAFFPSLLLFWMLWKKLTFSTAVRLSRTILNFAAFSRVFVCSQENAKKNREFFIKTAWFSPLAVIRYLQQPMVNNKFTKFTQLMLRELWHLTFWKSTRKKLYSKRRFASPFSPTVEGFIRFTHKQNNNFMFSLNPERNPTLNHSNTLVHLLSF